MSIKTKIVVVLALLIVLPVAVLGHLSYNRARSVMVAEMTEDVVAAIENAGNIIIDRYVGEAERALELFAEDATSLMATKEGSPDIPRKLWRSYLALNPEKWWLYFATADGGIQSVPQWRIAQGYDPRTRPWYRSAVGAAGRVVWTDPYLDAVSDEPVIAVVKAVSGGGTASGVIGLETRLHEVSRLLQRIKLANSGYYLLLSPGGRVIAGGNGWKFGEDLSQEAWYRGVLEYPLGTFRKDRTGSDLLVSYLTIESTGWKLVGIIPGAVLEEEIAVIKHRTLLVAAAGMIVAVLVGIFAFGYLMKRIDWLTAYMESVEAGDLTIRTYGSGGDEFTRLNRSFSRMVARMADTVKTLERLSVTDGLTVLYNHKYTIEKLEQEMEKARRYERPLSIIMFDVDHFKIINDNYGHQEGDRVLIGVADLMKRSLRGSDIIGRYGGEEFLAVLPETSLELARAAAERIRADMESWPWELENLRVTLSGGVKEMGYETLSELIDDADKLLYMAKENGRNRIEA